MGYFYTKNAHSNQQSEVNQNVGWLSYSWNLIVDRNDERLLIIICNNILSNLNSLANGMLMSLFVRGERKVIAIDLGTTKSAVALLGHGTPKVVPNERGKNSTPSVVAFTPEGVLIGEEALEHAAIDPENTVYDIKRLIGREFDDPSVQKDMATLSYRISEQDGAPVVHVVSQGKPRTITTTEITALILGKLKSEAEKQIGKPVQEAVVSVPAYFNNAQRQATKDAGALCGLNITQLVNEPTAAGIDFSNTRTQDEPGGAGETKKDNEVRNTLVFHMGGGSLDASIISSGDGRVEVKASSGNSSIGGRDFTMAISEHFIREFESQHQSAENEEKRQLKAKMYQACEKAKIRLSSKEKTDILIPEVIRGQEFRSTISREKFLELNRDNFKEAKAVVSSALKQANMKSEDIADVVLTGDATNMPKLQEDIKEVLQTERLELLDSHQGIVSGTAVHAIVCGKTEEVCPTVVKQVSDIMTITISTDIKGGIMIPLLERNSKVPATRKQVFYTATHNQTEMDMEIFEGERRVTKYNRSIGKFTLKGIPQGPRGKYGVEVTFHADVDGIFHISATEASSGSSSEITIQQQKGERSAIQLEEMVKDAENNQRADEKEINRIRVRNSLEKYLEDVTAILENTGHMFIPANVRPKVIHTHREVTEWLNQNQEADRGEYIKKLKEIAVLCLPYVEEWKKTI